MAANGFAEEFPRTEKALRQSSDAVFIFFCAYLMVRYTAYLTTKELPMEPLASSLDEAGIAFGVAALISILSVGRQHTSQNFLVNVGYVLMTAFLAGCGTVFGLVGITAMTAGFICAFLAALAVLQKASSFAGLLGGIAGAVVTGKMVGAAHIATGIIAGVLTGILITAVVLLMAVIVGTCVAFTMIAFLGEDSTETQDVVFVGMPTGFCSGLAAGFTVWLVDGFVLGVMDGIKDLPDGFVGGSIFGIIIGFVLGANIGFSTCYEQHARRNRETLAAYERQEV